MVGVVGLLVGTGDGAEVGRDVGRLVGTFDGRLDDGAVVGLLVSPGLVGREETGADDGAEVGDPLVGIEVGAETATCRPTDTDASLIDDIDDFASGVSRTLAPLSAAARKSCFENWPDDTDAATCCDREFVRSLDS